MKHLITKLQKRKKRKKLEITSFAKKFMNICDSEIRLFKI